MVTSQKETHRMAKRNGSIARADARADARAGKLFSARRLFVHSHMPLPEGFLNDSIYAEFNSPSYIELATKKKRALELQSSL